MDEIPRPWPVEPGSFIYINNPPVEIKGLMTLRDYFAAKAMQAMLASPELMVVVTADQVLGENAKERIANLSYKYADAMLEQRLKEKA